MIDIGCSLNKLKKQAEKMLKHIQVPSKMDRVLQLLENSGYQQQWFGKGISSNKVNIHFVTLGIRSKFRGCTWIYIQIAPPNPL